MTGNRLGMSGHQRTIGASDQWFTPRAIIDALGPFDLDPCTLVDRPWDTAARHFEHLVIDGLDEPWQGRVWLNPPYGPETGRWLARLTRHGNGIALIFARTETEMFHRWAWSKAHAMLFLRGRISFCKPDGSIGKNSGAPSVLIAYGEYNARRLKTCRMPGHYVHLKQEP